MNKKLTAIILALLMLLPVSCAINKPVEEEAPPVGASAEPTHKEPGLEPTEPEKTAAEVFLSEEPSASRVGRYLTDNASSLTARDGDLLLERLVLLQQDIADLMNVLIWDKAFMTALNETMGGVFTRENIDNVKDADVKQAFTEAADALMTVVRYEETPVFETDWKRLEEIGGAFSDKAAKMIDYRGRLQGDYYADSSQGFDKLAEDIVAIEDMLATLEGGFVRRQLRKIYGRQVSALFIGPEGSYLSEYVDEDSEFYLRLQKYADTYDGKFGEICRDLLEIQGEDSQTVMDYISGALIFPPDYPLTAEIAVTQDSEAWLSLPIISGGDNLLTDKINLTVRDRAMTMIESGRMDQTVSTYVAVCGDYMSITFACGYLDEEKQYHYKESGLVLDLTTGEPVTLDELVGKPFDSYKDTLLEAMRGYNIPSSLSPTFAFTLTDSGMTISLPSESGGWPEYYSVTLNGLRSFMDISKLY